MPKKCKVIFHMHASQFDLFYKNSNRITRFFIQSALNQVDLIVALSQNWAEFYQTITKTPVVVIQNAVHIPEKSLYNPESTTIVTFGKIGKRKGSYDLLQVAKEVGKEFPEIHFVLYGDGESEKIAQQIEMEQIKNVSLGGWIDGEQKEEVLKNMLLHFLPSYHEGLPMAILETMAAGIPNLATNVGGIPDVIKPGQNGMLATAGDRDEMARQLFCFLQTKQAREQYGQSAYEKIKTEYSIEEYHKRWNELYSWILKGKK